MESPSKPYKRVFDNPENPLKSLRHRFNLTQDQLAFQCHVSHNLIVRSEQGLYNDPNPTLLEYFSIRLDPSDTSYNREQIRLEYIEWVLEHRQASYGLLHESITLDVPSIPIPVEDYLLTLPPWVSPFVWWRELSGLKQIEVCKAYCVHPMAVSKVEKNIHLTNTIPGQLRSALLDSGYSQLVLDRFQDALTRYKDYL